MSKAYHSIIPAVWVIVTNSNSQVFLLRRANTGWRDGNWTVPAGHVEENEAPSAAAVRELQEEANINITASQLGQPLIYFYPEDARKNDRVSLFFILRNYDGPATNAEPHKADKAEWFTLSDLPAEMPPILKRAFVDIENDVRYSERYYDPKIHEELLQ